MNEKFKLAIIDNQEGIEAAAIDAAEAAMTADKSELKGFKGFLTKIWKHNLGKEFYRQKEIAKTKKAIYESGNLYVNEQGIQEDSDEAMSAIVDRFTSDYENMIHEDAGEKKEVLDDKKPEEKELKDKISNLIKEYASGNLDDKTFQEEKVRVLAVAKCNDKPVLDNANAVADNLLEVAKQIKANIAHGEKLEDMDLDFDVVIGKAKAGVRTEANYNRIDRIVEKISSTKIGSLVNEATVAGAVGAAYCLGSAISQRLAGSKLAAIGTLGAATALSGGIAAAKEGKRLEDERRQHSRELAQGKEFDKDTAKRRVEMEKFRYDTESANELKEKLENCLYEKDGSLKELTQADLEASLGNLANIEARIKVSDQKKVDLISFSDIKKVEQERWALDVTRAKAKVDLKNILEKRKDLNLPDDEKLPESLAKLTSVKSQMLLEDGGGVEELDRAFKKMKTKKMVNRALITVGVGLTFGSLLQEFKSFFDADQQGLIERLFDKKSEGKSATALEGIRRWLVGGDGPKLNGPIHEELINGGHFNLPEGTNFVANPDGSYNLMKGQEVLANNLTFNNNGSLTEEANAILAHNKIIANEDLVNTTVEKTTEGTTPEDIINNKKDLFHKVGRELWFDNNTKKSDLNELKTWWGGDGNKGFDDKGNYVFSVKHMTSGGSFHGNQSIDAKGLTGVGALKMIFSLSKETQNMVCEVPVDTDGNIVIDKDSEIGKLLFTTENGKAKFLGKFAEVVEAVGKNEDGSEKVRMLATHVGEGLTGEAGKQVVEQVESVVTGFDIPQDVPVDMPFFMPITSRTPLERVKAPSPKLIPDQLLLDNPSYPLVPYQNQDLVASKDYRYNVVENYLNSFSKEYKEQIEKLVNQAGPMEPTNELSVCIPVAGHKEGKNIYEALKDYISDAADPKKYEVCLFVNQPEKDENGNEVKPDETMSEINRFRKDFPKVNIKVLSDVLSEKQANAKTANRILLDTVVYRDHQRGKDAPKLEVLSTPVRRAKNTFEQVLLPDVKLNKNVDSFENQLKKIFSDKKRAPINLDNKKSLTKLKKELENIIAKGLGLYGGDKEDDAYYKESINSLGIKYNVDDKGEVKIENMDDLVKKLKGYQNLSKPRQPRKVKKATKATIK